MFKKSIFLMLGLIIATAFSACSYIEHYMRSEAEAEIEPEPYIRTENWKPVINLPTSVVVCRQKQCAPADLSMSGEYIYNSLLHLLDNNNQSKLLPCMADPKTHVCIESYLALPLTVGVTPAFMYINDAKISDVSSTVGRKTIDLILNYNVTFNGQTPVCRPAKTLIYVKNAKNIILEDAGYTCKMTTVGSSSVKTLFAIDYIDLDYGYIGGYYSIGVSGPAFGGGSGYMLLRLPKDAYPLAPELIYEPETTVEPDPRSEQTNEQLEETFEEELEEQPVIKADSITTPKIKVTVKTKTNPGRTSKNTGDTEISTTETTTEDVPEVNVEYTDYNGVQVFPLVKPRVKVMVESADSKESEVEILDAKPSEPQNSMAPASNKTDKARTKASN